ncbi:MAG: histidine--tRNA ligase [Thermoplasmata archaeon]
MIERPRGTRDLGPDEMTYRNYVEDQLRATCESYGYRAIQTPMFEHTKLFKEKSGPSIIEEIYAFKDKGGREIALRPEFTASVIRMYFQEMREVPKPVKIYYFGSAFRYERPQAGRYREFWQFGTELIGADTPYADAENIALAYNCISILGLTDIKLKISNLNILSDFLEENGVGKKEKLEVYHLVDKGEFDEIRDTFDYGDMLCKLIQSDLSEAKKYLKESSSISYLEKVTDLLSLYEIGEKDYSIDLSTVRGLDYYKGVVFEIEAERLGAEKQICGGGDYQLGDIFGGEITSKGFAIGFDRTILAMKEENIELEKKENRYYIIPIEEENKTYAYEVLKSLRDKNIIADIDLKGRSIGNAIGYADKSGFSHVILLGEEEVKSEEVSVKDLSTGKQESVEKKEFLENK